MKQIWKCENGEIEFESQEELERYFKGEKPELELLENGRYKAKFSLLTSAIAGCVGRN